MLRLLVLFLHLREQLHQLLLEEQDLLLLLEEVLEGPQVVLPEHVAESHRHEGDYNYIPRIGVIGEL